MGAPNDLVNGERGRFPIYTNAQIYCVRYRLKLTRVNEDRMPFNFFATRRVCTRGG